MIRIDSLISDGYLKMPEIRLDENAHSLIISEKQQLVPSEPIEDQNGRLGVKIAALITALRVHATHRTAIRPPTLTLYDAGRSSAFAIYCWTSSYHM